MGWWADSLATALLRVESRDDLLPGLRYLALDRAVYWFRLRAEQRDIQAPAVADGQGCKVGVGATHPNHRWLRSRGLPLVVGTTLEADDGSDQGLRVPATH